MFGNLFSKNCLVLFKKFNKAYKFRYHKFIFINDASLLIDIKFLAQNKENCFPLFINCLVSYFNLNKKDFNKKIFDDLINEIINHRDFIQFLISESFDNPIFIDNDKISDGTVINITKQSIYYVK